MKMSLRGHGIRCDGGPAGARNHQSVDAASGAVKELVRGRFFVDPRDEALWGYYRAHFADKVQGVITDAETICRHEFNLLGSGGYNWGTPIDWHVDPISGHRWPKRFFFELKRLNGAHKADVKVPWELSRLQHLFTLGKAYRLTRNDRYAEEVVGQISHWWGENPCPYGVNWLCAMDVAIRAMNLIWGYLLIADAPAVTDVFRARLASSVYEHGQFILFNLEHGVRADGSIVNGNHYLTDVGGLLHLGLLCPGLAGAETWRDIGVAALIEEMDRQVHADGMDFESSIAYHRLVLELMVAGALLCRLNGRELPPRFWAKLEKMFEFILFVTRPDGKVPHVGDADNGRLYILSDYGSQDHRDFRYLLSIGAVLFQRADMKAYAGGFSEEAFWLLGPSGATDFATLRHEGQPLGSRGFRDSGIYVMRSADRYLLASCGAVGTRGLGNHKHNDLLSFELYAGDKAFIVDPGTYVYSRDPHWRNVFRSTHYHNTVVIDGHEQNDFQASQLFRMTPDAKVIVHEWVTTPERDWLSVEHSGYLRLDQPVRHKRTFLFEKRGGSWEIADELVGPGDHAADWYFHFDQGITLEDLGKGSFRTCSPGSNLIFCARSEAPLVCSIIDGWNSRSYGHKAPASVLHIHAEFTAVCHMAVALCPV
jgi:Heparinase II/III-like protein/Heparinase II/III N-terminus